MKKTLLILAGLFTFGLTHAQITQGTIGNGNFIDWEGNTINDVYGLDFNNDGTLEFNIHNGSYNMDGVSYSGGGETHNVMCMEGWDFMATLNPNDIIDANGSWTGYGDAMLNYEGDIPSSYYVGFRIKYDDGFHYGWAKVAFANNTASWEQCYYNATPNVPIQAGQTTGGTQGIESVKMNVSIATLGNAQLNVNTDNTMKMEIYDLGGKKIMQTQTNNTITLPSMGIYIIRINQFSQKVLVL